MEYFDKMRGFIEFVLWINNLYKNTKINIKSLESYKIIYIIYMERVTILLLIFFGYIQSFFMFHDN